MVNGFSNRGVKAAYKCGGCEWTNGPNEWTNEWTNGPMSGRPCRPAPTHKTYSWYKHYGFAGKGGVWCKLSLFWPSELERRTVSNRLKEWIKIWFQTRAFSNSTRHHYLKVPRRAGGDDPVPLKPLTTNIWPRRHHATCVYYISEACPSRALFQSAEINKIINASAQKRKK